MKAKLQDKVKTVKGKLRYITKSIYLYSYQCPDCKVVFEDYSLTNKVVSTRCKYCQLVVQIKWPKNVIEPMIFEINIDQLKLMEKWKKKHDIEKSTYQYIFTPTGIGINLTVVNKHNKESIDLSEYDKW
jgi:hypothetical protein